MKKINRRNFLKSSSLFTAGSLLGGSAISAKSYSNIMGANDRVNFAVVGVRSRGMAHGDALSQCENAAITHVCDVDTRYIDRFNEWAGNETGNIPKVVRDYRRLMEDPDVDAVSIATPDHWHAPMSIMALQNGKHVYVEKPLSHNPHEGELLVKAQEKYGHLVQMGNQQRSSRHTIEIIRRIHEGLIGNTYYAKAWYSNSRGSIGTGRTTAVPAYLDWELWQGPAPRRPYRDNIHPYNWHWFWHYGTGETLNNGTHEVDVCRWALQVDMPSQVSAPGGRYHFNDDWEFYDTLNTSFTYSDDRMISWEGKSCNNKPLHGRGRGAMIHGTTGSVLIDRGGYIVYDLDGEVQEEFSASEAAGTSDLRGMDDMTVNHFQNFIDGITRGERLESPAVEGNKSVTMLQLSNIAWKNNRILDIDEETGHILNDELAMRMWRREYEPGWEPEL